MKKIFSLFIALLFIAGSVFAASIPDAGDPTGTPEVWIMDVYNVYTSELVTGMVVIWDMDSSTGTYRDQLPYVTSTVTADHVRCAGVVVGRAIPASDVGSIAIFGPVETLIADSTDAVTVDELVSTSTVRGAAGGFTTASDSGYLGLVVNDEGHGTDTEYMVIMVNPGNDG